jgi:hypothetical protein
MNTKISELLGIQHSNRPKRTQEVRCTHEDAIPSLPKSAECAVSFSAEAAPLQRTRSAESYFADHFSSGESIVTPRSSLVHFQCEESTPRVLSRTRSFQFDSIDDSLVDASISDAVPSSSSIIASSPSAVGPASTILMHLHRTLLEHECDSDRTNLLSRMCEIIGNRKVLQAVIKLILESDDTLSWVANCSYSHDNGMFPFQALNLDDFSHVHSFFQFHVIAGFDKFVLGSYQGYRFNQFN